MVSWAMRAASTSPAANAAPPALPAAANALGGEVNDAGSIGSRRAEQPPDGLVGDASRLDVARGKRSPHAFRELAEQHRPRVRQFRL
ncbi:hypothetical protein [Sorangium sp. So ce145]|uniref:hypothetical protein n=1 Tax=Sorangium sp. So ce145 TaxID=3133285 RepID=UPI003F5F8DBA